MDNIEDVYSNDVYYPFILYCEGHNYHTMQDLRRCNFENLIKAPGITSGLLMRIKSLYTAYCKKHPDMHMGKAPAPRPKRVQVPDAGLEMRLQEHFKSHADTLVRIADVCKELSVKRIDAMKVLQNASWCKAVDGTTFFYGGSSDS